MKEEMEAHDEEFVSWNVKAVQGKVQAAVYKLADDGLARLAGPVDRISGTGQERYGTEQAEARKPMTEFLDRLETEGTDARVNRAMKNQSRKHSPLPALLLCELMPA